MIHVVRLLVAVVATLMLLGGLAAILAGLGAAGLVVVLLERRRYGSEPDDAPSSPADRLRRTDEVFVDPTTGQRTRVWIDPQSGQRTYRPEGD